MTLSQFKQVLELVSRVDELPKLKVLQDLIDGKIEDLGDEDIKDDEEVEESDEL